MAGLLVPCILLTARAVSALDVATIYMDQATRLYSINTYVLILISLQHCAHAVTEVPHGKLHFHVQAVHVCTAWCLSVAMS